MFSFKLRGAYNKIAHLPREALEKGIICASAGNHAQGVALAAQRLGARATIVMPRTTPAIKIQAVRDRGGKICLLYTSYPIKCVSTPPVAWIAAPKVRPSSFIPKRSGTPMWTIAIWMRSWSNTSSKANRWNGCEFSFPARALRRF